MAEILRFQINIPEEVALKFPTGKDVQGQYGPQVMFTTVDDRVFYLDAQVAQQLYALRIQPGEPLRICKTENRQGQKRFAAWDIRRVMPDPRWQSPNGQPMVPPAQAPAPLPAPQVTRPMGASNGNGTQQNGGVPPSSNGSANGHSNGNGHANSNGHGAPVPMKAGFGDAFQEFLILAGRATRAAEVQLGQEGGSVRFDSRDVAAIATTMFIQAATSGWLTWKPGGVR